MSVVPIAAFLTGALLTLLLPVALLIALVVWYWIVTVRAPETPRGSAPDAALTADPGPDVAEALPPEPKP